MKDSLALYTEGKLKQTLPFDHCQHTTCTKQTLPFDHCQHTTCTKQTLPFDHCQHTTCTKQTLPFDHCQHTTCTHKFNPPVHESDLLISNPHQCDLQHSKNYRGKVWQVTLMTDNNTKPISTPSTSHTPFFLLRSFLIITLTLSLTLSCYFPLLLPPPHRQIE